MNTTIVNAELQTASRFVAGIEVMHNPAASFDRRHDLDALRAIAMLLGIVLHVGLAFAPLPWPVQDSQQSDFYYLLFACIHGFRMPLFFMLSGFFTAMLWRKRGLASLIKHRLKRIFLPLVIGCFTIVPAMWAVSYVAALPSPGSAESSPLFAAVVSGDFDRVHSELQKPDNGIDTLDSNSGASSLCTAVFLGHAEIVELLVSTNADVNLPDRGMSSPLHIAAFMGRAKEAAVLLDAGANVNALDGRGITPRELLKTDFGTTNFIASSLGVSVDEVALLAGRKEIAELLGATDYLGSEASAGPEINLAALTGLLFQLPVFMHLWFLWFLCWLVAAFLIYASLAKVMRVEKWPSWLVCSPLSLLLLIPLTMFPQSFMETGTFGADSSIGLIPIPRVLIYYAIFFFFGAVYWDMNDTSGRLGSGWAISLPFALLVVFPIGLDVVSGAFGIVPKLEDESINALVGCFLQATYAWLMIFGAIGLFRRLLANESPALRYISDASYWMYLVHLPLVILAQWLVRDWPIPAILKFAAITLAISALLLVTYEYGVRYTAIGRLLNGSRTRAAPAR